MDKIREYLVFVFIYPSFLNVKRDWKLLILNVEEYITYLIYII